MANVTTHPPASRAPVEIAIDRVWRFFCSVRAAVAEIVILALLVLIGTLRGSAVPQWIADAIPASQGLVDRWYAWDVYRSPVFAVLLAVMAVAIAVCTVNRVPGIWQTISNPKIRTTASFLKGADTSAAFAASTSGDDLRRCVEKSLRQKRYRVLTQHVGNETHLYADKNRYGKLGTFPFHLALILLLVGGIVGAYYGFREPEFVIPVGETRPVGNGTDLSVRLDSFEDGYTPGGVPTQFRSNVSILEDGKTVRTEQITVNQPVSYRNATFYQSGFGYTAQMRVVNRAGATVYAGQVALGIFNLSGNPESPAGYVEIPGTGTLLTVVAPDTNPRNAPDTDVLKLENGQMWVQLQPVGSTGAASASPETLPAAVVDQGKPVQVGDFTVTFERESRYTNLQVAYNPGIPIFFIASVLLVGGLVGSFYFPLRRIRGIIAPAPSGAVLTMAPLARRDWSGKRDFFAVVESIGVQLNIEPSIRKPADHKDWEGLIPVASNASQTR
ncbi:MAG: hypothetical protein AVDCRST_MAG87-2105 [uncultured Thermomicrobiales bacterium]|uniref:ResB-like domain-containing protein n=1 Tax=uncultured Thermomicrobiales bacterium TaxID=1645740 RepID=A0A6J4V5W9_9BACT|nr:MAG: hypothetical protein AVDCRST_MAG87-2105 [uncultured Thermomicrobiales bacterium]